MNWRQKLLDKWPYKVAAGALALLLWVNVTDDERLVQPLRTEVTYEVLDEDYVLVDAPDEIRTSFSGRRADLVSLSFDPPTIRIPIEEVTDTVMQVEVSLSEVTYETGTAIRPVGVSPSTLTLRFEAVTRRLLPVYPVAQLAGPLLLGFILLGLLNLGVVQLPNAQVLQDTLAFLQSHLDHHGRQVERLLNVE